MGYSIYGLLTSRWQVVLSCLALDLLGLPKPPQSLQFLRSAPDPGQAGRCLSFEMLVAASARVASKLTDFARRRVGLMREKACGERMYFSR